MAKIYRRTDRIPVRINDITVKLAPLTFDQKTEIQSLMVEGRMKGDMSTLSKGTVLSLKYSIKDLQGMVDSDGKPYLIGVDEAGNLTDECIDDLLSTEENQKLQTVCLALIRGVPSAFLDEKGSPMDGVEFVGKESAGPNA